MEKVVKEFVSSVKTISENGKTIERLLRELRDSLGRLLEGVVEEIRPQLKTNVEYQTSREVKIEKEILPVVESCCDGWLHDGKRLHLGLSIHYHRICLWVKADRRRSEPDTRYPWPRRTLAMAERPMPPIPTKCMRNFGSIQS